MRFRLLELFGLTFVVALGLGALARSGTLLEPIFFSLTLGLILAAVLLAIAVSDGRRFYWIGFSVAGIAYLWCVSTPVESSGEPFSLEGSRSLMTTRTLDWIWGRMHPAQMGGMGTFSVNFQPPANTAGDDDPFAAPIMNMQSWAIPGTRAQSVVDDSYNGFFRAGHCLFALLIAWISGYFTQWMHLRGRASQREMQ